MYLPLRKQDLYLTFEFILFILFLQKHRFPFTSHVTPLIEGDVALRPRHFSTHSFCSIPEPIEIDVPSPSPLLYAHEHTRINIVRLDLKLRMTPLYAPEYVKISIVYTITAAIYNSIQEIEF